MKILNFELCCAIVTIVILYINYTIYIKYYSKLNTHYNIDQY
jgi:hypothetical protein